jgi:hypothetical protein
VPSRARPFEIGVSGCAIVDSLATELVLISGVGFELVVGVGV